MGQYGVLFVDWLLESGDIIGFLWGCVVCLLVENLLQVSQLCQVICVFIIGGFFGKLESCYYVNILIYGVVVRLKVEFYFVDFLVLLDNLLICNGIMQFQYFKIILFYWDSLDVVLVGIGLLVICDGVNWYVFYGSEESDDFNVCYVVGDICLCFYDINGGLVDINMSEKILLIEMVKLCQVCYFIGIVMGEEKYFGIFGVLYGCYINCLVINREMVELLLK